jgi:23S rRNA pseudouridine1911/1915/1917 synthase
MNKTITVEVSDAGQRLDTFLADKTGITRSQIQKLIDSGNVLVNGGSCSRHHKVRADDLVSLSFPREETGVLIPAPIPLEILFRDEYIAVVDKPAGMVVYPAAGHADNTLMNALAYHCGKLATVGGPLRPGVVHRLDKETSGIMVVALDDIAYYNLIEQFRERSMNRRYVALAYGNIKEDRGEIAVPIGRSESDRKKMSTRVRRGKEAITRWRVLERSGVATLLELRLGTGRTHQIRVHLASIGYPVLGDKTYGRKTEIEIRKRKIPIPRQMLHAEMLGFIHPASGEYMEFSSPVPEDMKIVMDELGRSNSGNV